MIVSDRNNLSCSQFNFFFFLDQGLTPMLSRVWVPLNEYIPNAMEALIRGEIHVVTPPTIAAFEKYERPRVEHVLQMASRKGFQVDENFQRAINQVPN